MKPGSLFITAAFRDRLKPVSPLSLSRPLSGLPRTRLLSKEPYISVADHSLPLSKTPCYLYVPQGENSTVIVDTHRSLLALLKRSPWSVPLPSIQNPAYGIKKVKGKGKGMVARRMIEPGELLVSERPVYTQRWSDLAVPSDYTMSNGNLVLGALEGLSSASQAVFRALTNAQDGRVHELSGILSTNALNHHMDSTFSLDYAGLFPTISRANHSCTPNANFFFSIKRFAGELRATKTIMAGEELSYIYIDPLAPRSTRLEDLERRYRFRCGCAACRGGGSESDDRRRRIREVVDLLEQSMRADRHSMNTPLTLNELVEVAKFAEEEGLVMHRTQILFYGGARLAKLGRKKLAQEWFWEAEKQLLWGEGQESPALKSLSAGTARAGL